MANPEHLEILKQGVEVWNAWREENRTLVPDLSFADLSGGDFHGANLQAALLISAELKGANLKDANLVRAILLQADLRKADLSGAQVVMANLQSADLERAILTGASISASTFIRANLSGAKLFKANLVGANFNGAELREVDFTEATLSETILANVDLGDAFGFETCEHLGRSVIDRRTFTISPFLYTQIKFLRGCGLLDWEIEASRLHNFMLKPHEIERIQEGVTELRAGREYYSCFISYSSKNEDFARKLHSNLQDSGVRCWFAPEGSRGAHGGIESWRSDAKSAAKAR